MFVKAPEALWFAFSLPVILAFYLLKRTYVDTPVSSHLLWNRVLKDLQANRPWQKLRNRLLMYMQLLAAALLVFALMQPHVWSDAAAGKRHAVLVVDNSASMQSASPDENGAAERIADKMKRQVADWLRREGNGKNYTLLVMGSEPELLLSRESSPQAVERALAELPPHFGKTAYRETMSLAAAIVRDDPDAQVVLFTDGHWTESADGLTVPAPVTVVRMASTQPANVGIVQFGVRGGMASAGRTAGSGATVTADNDLSRTTGNGTSTANGSDASSTTGNDASTAAGSGTLAADGIGGVVVVQNFGAVAREFTVSVYSEERFGETRRLSLAPGEQQSVYFSRLQPADWYRAELDVHDDLAEDNVAYAFPAGERRLTALYAGEGNLFLEKALALAQVDLIKTQRQNGAYVLPHESVDLVILDGVSEEAIAGEEWRQLLAEKPIWRIYGEAPSRGFPVSAEYELADHPVTRYLDLTDTHIAEAAELNVPAWGKAIIRSDGMPLVIAGEENGNGRLLFAFDLQRSDMPLRPAFPILVRNAVEWLGSGKGASLGTAVAGSIKEIAFASTTVRAAWTAFPGGEVIELAGGDEPARSEYRLPSRPGLYRLDEFAASGQRTTSRYLAVTMDPAEGNLAAETNLDFAGQSGRAGEGGGAGGTMSSERAALPLAPYLAALVLLVVLSEWGVYHRGHSI